MSPNVGNFVHDLVEMAKAMETLPQVEQELSRVKAELDKALQTVQDRELSLIGSRDEINLLNAKVRTVEAERDDAELRFLELDEKAHSVMGMLIDFEGKAKGARLILDPPKTQPGPVVKQQVPDPEPSVPEAVHSIEPDWKQDQAETSLIKPQDQSEVNPTVPIPSEETNSSVQSSAIHEVSVASPNGPYTGKRYFDVSGYVSHLDWLEGGGTEENYNWRPTY